MLWCCDGVACICACNEVRWCPYPTILRPSFHSLSLSLSLIVFHLSLLLVSFLTLFISVSFSLPFISSSSHMSLSPACVRASLSHFVGAFGGGVDGADDLVASDAIHPVAHATKEVVDTAFPTEV